MWAHVNTKPLQGMKCRAIRGELKRTPVGYDNEVEQLITHPLLLPKQESMYFSRGDTEVLKKLEITAPKKNRV